MRIGFLTDPGLEALDWARANGFGSISWMGFKDCFAAPGREGWQDKAREFAAHARANDVRITAIGAYYRNPLDPRQTDSARAIWQRAIDIAAMIGTRTVSGFAGAIVEPRQDDRGGHVVYAPFEQFLPQIVSFWEEIARYAADRGVRIAFEHCPQGAFHLPLMHYNIFGQVAMWERFFNATKCENIGIEWDASHLVCQFIDPVANIQKYGSRIFHVHAKDAYINRPLLEQFGLCHPGVAEHRLPGFGQVNWAELIHALLRVGYDSDLNIEGWHDPLLRDHPETPPGVLAGRKLERPGLLLAKRWLEQFVPREPAPTGA